MAFGFTPKHIEEFHLNELTQEQFIVIALEVAKKIKWSVNYTSKSGLIAYTENGMFSWNAEIEIKIENGIARLKSSSTGTEMMDWGKNKKNIERFISTFNALKETFSQDELDLKRDELTTQLALQQEDILKLPPQSRSEQFKGFFSIFIPTEGYFITPILLNINILVFLLMALSGVNIILPDSASLLKWGANFRPMTLEGEWWRLLTNCFLHIGIFHLLMNMYALVYIGILLEPILGKSRFISAYILTGITASLASIWWHDLIISAGASGAIFGMYGVFLALLTTKLIEKNKRNGLLASIAIFVVYNLMYGMKDGIDNAAHIGGLISGLIIGYSFIPGFKKHDSINLKYSIIGVLTFLILTISFAAYKNIPNDFGTYDKKMKRFISMEAVALEVFKMPQNTPKNKLLYGLKERGIYYWKENIKLIEEVEKLNLPIEFRIKNSKLKQYCELRIKSYELLYKSIEDNIDANKVQIEIYNSQIQAIITDLTKVQQNN